MIDIQTQVLYQDIKRTNPFIYKLKKSINWDKLSQSIENKLPKKESTSGRPPYSVSLMLKILILQEINGLSDDAMEVQINGSIYFKYFLDMDLMAKSPDAKTIWLFKDKLCSLGLERVLFDEFHRFLTEQNITVSKGSIVDASFVSVPIQRNTKKENNQIKEGKTPEAFKENKHKLRQKDIDARWVTKNGKNYYGYKNHIVTPTNEQFISEYAVTAASVHDSQVIEDILSEECTQVYADSAYRSKKISDALKEKKTRNYIHERSYKDRPLTEEQRASNRWKSRTRAKVEHVFAWFHNCMNRGLSMRCIGFERVKFRIGIRNTCYNIIKYISLRVA